jgi:hypothetical protein
MSAEYNYYRGRERRRVGILKKRGSVLTLIGSKRKVSLLILIMLFLMMVPPASADLVTVNSRWTYTIPTIDATIASGEWADAEVVDFTFDMRFRGIDISQDNLSARFYVKNDENNIYAAVEIFDEDYDARDSGDFYDGFALLFEDNHDHVLVDGDNGEGIRMWIGSPSHANNDWYYNSSSSWIPDGASPPFGAGKTNDGEFAWTHTNKTENAIGDYTFEMKIPLVGADGDAYDLAITSLPETLGFKIWFFEMDLGTDGVYPDDTAYHPNGLETEDGTKFGNLVLAKRPPPPVVGGMAAPIVIPINEPNLLTPLIWLATAIIVPIALTVVFVKLKKKKL